MALFKPYRGARSDLPAEMHDGYAYFCVDDGSFHIDFVDSNGTLQRKQINAQNAETLTGKTLQQIQESVTEFIITGSYEDNYLSLDGSSRDIAEGIESAYENQRPMSCIITTNSIPYHLQFEYCEYNTEYHFGLCTGEYYHHVMILLGGGRVEEKTYTQTSISSQNNNDIYTIVRDNTGDDTEVFTSALANNRKVYVPGGNYYLSSGINIKDNSELTLAQDAVLNFTNTSGNCITLNMSSSLRGNHATINVPYAFSGNVIYADTATTTNTSAVPPFTKWSPQWKSGRYITDINICKADSRGFHYSVNGDTNGTAVYLAADGDKTLSHMWGVNYSGLRIAGGFKYGIRAANSNAGWLHEMRIEAFIDACEIGVSLENCNNAYISATIQPRRAYTTAKVYLPYAKCGIELINSRNTDLSGSRVWDWHVQDNPNTEENEKSTLWELDNEYQHISMKGNCSGTILNDFLYYEHSTADIRDLIYTDTASNLEKITILQEPFTRWFKPIEGEPYFYNGLDNKKILIEGALDPYFQVDVIKNYTDALTTATDASGNIFNGIGYQRGVRFTSLGTGTTLTESAYYMVTGFIPVKPGTTIYTKDLRFSDTTQVYAGIVYYNSTKTRFANMAIGHVVNGNEYYVINYTETADGCSFTIPNKAGLTNDDLSYLRFCFPISGVGEKPSISINEPISETVAGFLADGVKVKAANIVGSFSEYQQVSNKVTSLSASSTDAQYPSAKAVYTALQSALGEYVTDIASLVGGDA